MLHTFSSGSAGTNPCFTSPRNLRPGSSRAISRVARARRNISKTYASGHGGAPNAIRCSLATVAGRCGSQRSAIGSMENAGSTWGRWPRESSIGRPRRGRPPQSRSPHRRSCGKKRRDSTDIAKACEMHQELGRNPVVFSPPVFKKHPDGARNQNISGIFRTFSAYDQDVP